MNNRIEPSEGVLYIVGTPIGNLGDLSPRARSVLEKVSIIACEDTRYSGQLIRRIGSKAPLFSFYRHNTQKKIPQLISFLDEGKSVALISDAGMPGISDPGEQLVSRVREAGFEVITIPGACAAITALASSGFPSERFCFEGFLPHKGSERKKRLNQIEKETRTSIIYESPHRLIQLLEELTELCGNERQIHIARELTKLHEQKISSDIKSALEHFRLNKPIGEFTIILKGNTSKQDNELTEVELLQEMQELIKEGKSARDAAKQIAQSQGLSKRKLYNLLHNQDNYFSNL